MNRFRVGISQGVRTAAGEMVIHEFDLSPLDDDSRIECVSLPDTARLDVQAVAGLDAVILMLEAVTEETFDGSGRLSLIARFGVGYDRIDVPTCTRNAVALAITPGGVRRPVAVSVITLMLALTSRLMTKDRIAREGPAGWARKAQYNGFGLVGRTLGSLGMGLSASRYSSSRSPSTCASSRTILTPMPGRRLRWALRWCRWKSYSVSPMF
jgi:phosphoglycerate dehydrogenase-like enzyme